MSNPADTVSPWPIPPEFALEYTNAAIANRFAPAPPPIPTEWTAFGVPTKQDDEIIRPLAAQGIPQLYPARPNWKAELKKLNRSAVAAFLDLLDILVRCPDSSNRVQKLNDIHTIFINMHHLINEYRPLQARDTVLLIQREQTNELKGIIERFRTHLEAGREALKASVDLSHFPLLPIPAVIPQERMTDEQREEERRRKEQAGRTMADAGAAGNDGLVAVRRRDASLLSSFQSQLTL